MNIFRVFFRSATLFALLLLPLVALAQIFTPEGPLQVMDETGGSAPATVVLNAAGDAVVVFRLNVNGRGHIYGRLIRADGTLVGSAPFLISSEDDLNLPAGNAPSNEGPVGVSSGLDGRFVVSWQRRVVFSPSRSQIRVRRFVVQSEVVQAEGASLLVADDIDLNHTDAYISADIAGGFVVAWTSIGPDGRFPLFTGYDAADQIVIPRTVALDPIYGSGTRGDVSGVAKVLSSGRFALLWRPTANVASDPCNGQLACIRFYDANGEPQTSHLLAVDPEGLPTSDPGLAADFSGNFLVAYCRRVLFGGIRGEVRLRRFDRDGEELTSERTVNITPGCGPNMAVAATSLAGNILLSSWYFGDPPRIFGKWLPGNYDDPASLPVPEFVVENLSGNFNSVAAATMSLAGNMVVAWHAAPGGLVRTFARRFAAPVEIRINDVAVAEGDLNRASAAFTVQLSKAHPAGAPIAVSYQTEEGSATATVDYTPVSGTLNFNGPSQLFQPLIVPVIDDNSIEEDETYFVRLFGFSNAVITRGRGIGTILNDDEGGILLVRNASMMEGDSGEVRPLNFEVTLSEPQGLSATVSYVTVDESAVAGSDYRATFGTLTIPAGFTTAFASVDIFGDNAFESDETFRVLLFDPVASVVGPAAGSNAGRGTIISDDLCPLLPTISPDSASFPVAGGSDVIAVSDSANCGWRASTATPWISITSSPDCPPGSPPACPHGGTGDGQLVYTVDVSQSVNQRIGSLSVADLPVNVTQDGIQCNFTLTPPSAVFTSSGGSGSFAVNASDPICEWTAESQAPWLLITESTNCPSGSPLSCGHGGTGSGTVGYTLGINEDVDRSSGIIAAATLFTVDQAGFFFDDFDNGVLSPLWDYSNPGLWSEANSRLIGNASASASARAIARPAFFGCIECTITAKLRFDQFAQGRARLFGWYLDGDTHVELEADEFANLWTLRQRVGGNVVASLSLPFSTTVNRDYTVELEYDGKDIRLSIDGNLAGLLTPPTGATPDGTVGFEVESHLISFDLIKAVTVTESVAQFPEIFASGFEPVAP